MTPTWLTFLKILFVKSIFISSKMPLMLVPWHAINYNLAVVQVMARHRNGGRLLRGTMLTQITDEYMRHQAPFLLKWIYWDASVDKYWHIQ